MVWLAALAGAGWLLAAGRFAPLLFALAFVLWILGEHPAHRHVLHMRRPRSEFGRKLIARLHYDHHRDPTNAELLFLPFWVSAMNERYWFGVSNPVGDWLWSTYPPVDDVEKSNTARDLEAKDAT